MEKGEAGELRAASTACREELGGQRESWTDPNSQCQEQVSQRPESCPGRGGTWAIRLPPEPEESRLACLMQRSRRNGVTAAKAAPHPHHTHSHMWQVLSRVWPVALPPHLQAALSPLSFQSPGEPWVTSPSPLSVPQGPSSTQAPQPPRKLSNSVRSSLHHRPAKHNLQGTSCSPHLCYHADAIVVNKFQMHPKHILIHCGFHPHEFPTQ